MICTIGRPHNFAILKIYYWLLELGEQVILTNTPNEIEDLSIFDSLWVSCVFGWEIPDLIKFINKAKLHVDDINIGGPVFAHKYIVSLVYSKTGVLPHAGLDHRFEKQKGLYYCTYFSRGCPEYIKSCGDCPVILIEGKKQSLYYDAEPARALYDNNITSLPIDFQEFIVEQYRKRLHPNVRGVFLGAGFNPNSLTLDVIKIWERMPQFSKWKVALDGHDEIESFIKAVELLKSCGYGRNFIQSYCKIGHEPRQQCFERIKVIIEAGAIPRPVINNPLTNISNEVVCDHDWDKESLFHFRKFYHTPDLYFNIKPGQYHSSLSWIDWMATKNNIENKKTICGVESWPYEESLDRPYWTNSMWKLIPSHPSQVLEKK